jgi:exoribonuclease-2
MVTRLSGLPQLDRGQLIELKIQGFDELGLELDCNYQSTIGPIPEVAGNA